MAFEQISQLVGSVHITWSTAAPTAGASGGYYNVGDICLNSAPAADAAWGWVCTVAGNPGTWKAIAYAAPTKFIGSTNAISWGSAAPATGTHAVGDLHINTAGTKGGPLGWLCINATGSGTWQPVGLADQDSYVTIGAGTTITAYYRRIRATAAGTITIAAATGFPVGSPLSIRADSASVTIVPAAGQIDSAAAATLGANAHITLIRETAGTVWWSYTS